MARFRSVFGPIVRLVWRFSFSWIRLAGSFLSGEMNFPKEEGLVAAVLDLEPDIVRG